MLLVSSIYVTLVNSIISGLGKLWFSVQLRSLIKPSSDFFFYLFPVGYIMTLPVSRLYIVNDRMINECGTVGGVKKKCNVRLKCTEHCLQLRMVSSDTLLSSFRQLHAGFSPQDLGFSSARLRAGFMVDEVTL
jgi:hypothetical protein